MSNMYNAAAMAYKAFDIDNLPEDKPVKDIGLLSRKTEIKGLDTNNPAVRVAKQMQVIRKFRNDMNGTTE